MSVNYSGYSNYETLEVQLHFDDTLGMLASGYKNKSVENLAAIFEKEIKESTEACIHCNATTLVNQIIDDFMSKVNWDELAETYWSIHNKA
jgi:hypothetical protein